MQLQTRFKQKKEKGCAEDPALLPKRESTRKETKKEIPKEKVPRGTSPSGKSNTPICYHFQKKRNPHAIVGTHQNANTSSPKVAANGVYMCVFQHTGKAGENKSVNATVAKNTSDHQRRNNSECDIVAMRKDTSVQEKEKDLHRVLWSGDERMIAIFTPLLVRICINGGLGNVKKNQELQHGGCTKHIYKIREENNEYVLQNKDWETAMKRACV